MPRRPPERKLPVGRPQIEIDWKRVDQMVLAGCSGPEIAGALDICPDTLYDRTTQEKGVNFSEYKRKRDVGGIAMIKTKQFTSAMQGNTRMLQTLGEERCGQGRKFDDRPPLDDLLNRDLEIISLKGQIQELRSIIEGYTNASRSQANQIDPRGDSSN